MVLDHLNNSSFYNALHPLLQKAFNYLQQVKESDFEKSKEEIQGDDCFALFFKGEGKNPDPVLLEAHRKYIDVHYIFKGSDSMAFHPINECKHIHTAYVEKDDYMLFSDKPGALFDVAQNCFTLFFPADAHAPLLGKETVWKVVIKLKV